MTMRRVLSAFVAAAFWLACGLPTRDEFARGTAAADSGTDGPVIGAFDAGDAMVVADAGADAREAGSSFINLLKEPDFEDGTCGDASFYQGVGTYSTDAHTGHGACQVCRQKESFDGYTYNPYVVLANPTVGTRYIAHAWVKLGPNSFKDQLIGIAVRTHQNNPYVQVEQLSTEGVPLTATWTYLEISMVVSKPAETLDFLVYVVTAATAGERCFVIDDVAEGVDVSP